MDFCITPEPQLSKTGRKSRLLSPHAQTASVRSFLASNTLQGKMRLTSLAYHSCCQGHTSKFDEP